jgi:DNA-directed RNA polymerase subunit RPC12/RpoP
VIFPGEGDETMMIFDLKTERRDDAIPGKCAHCGKPVWESLSTLDDAYNVWAGTCPHCGAINLLSLIHGLRGYDSKEMFLVLPTPEEQEANDLPKDIPLSPSTGQPATMHGSPLGELMHKMMAEPE